MEFTELLKTVSDTIGAPWEEMEDGLLKIVVPIPQDKENVRSQIIVVRLIHGLGYAPDKEVIAVASVIGKLNEKMDLRLLMKENENMIYGKVALDREDHVVIYGFTLFESANLDELVYLIKEVAYGADRLEEIYFGGKDKN